MAATWKKVSFSDHTHGSLVVADAGTIGLGSGKGLIQFDDETPTDFVSLLNCNVGIGTTNPLAKLQVHVATNQNVHTLSYNGGVFEQAINDAGDTNTLYQITGNPLSLNPFGGNVGIGTATPNHLLDLGTIYGTNVGDAAAKKLAIYQVAVGTTFYGLGVATHYLEFHAASAATGMPGMVLKDNGNVGIGTATPDALFHVEKTAQGAVGGRILITNLAPNAASSVADIAFRISEDYGNLYYSGRIANIHTGTTNLSDFAFFLYDVGAPAGTEKMRILNSGNVGIGTAAPSEKLDVVGNINLTGVLKVDAVQVVKEQQASVADASTAAAITDPADTPASADALRDDLVTNTIPSIESALNAIATQLNLILTRLEAHGLIAT